MNKQDFINILNQYENWVSNNGDMLRTNKTAIVLGKSREIDYCSINRQGLYFKFALEDVFSVEIDGRKLFINFNNSCILNVDL